MLKVREASPMEVSCMELDYHSKVRHVGEWRSLLTSIAHLHDRHRCQWDPCKQRQSANSSWTAPSLLLMQPIFPKLYKEVLPYLKDADTETLSGKWAQAVFKPGSVWVRCLCSQSPPCVPQSIYLEYSKILLQISLGNKHVTNDDIQDLL